MESPLLKLSLLYVDDDATNLRVVTEMLTPCGVTVTCCSSGTEALRQIIVERYDAVLMDFHMPGMNGVEALQEIRKITGPNQDIPVVALTADPSMERTYEQMGFSGYLAKPVSLRPLLDAAVLWSLKRGSPSGAPRFGKMPAWPAR